jgi:hypothetical protein
MKKVKFILIICVLLGSGTTLAGHLFAKEKDKPEERAKPVKYHVVQFVNQGTTTVAIIASTTPDTDDAPTDATTTVATSTPQSPVTPSVATSTPPVGTTTTPGPPNTGGSLLSPIINFFAPTKPAPKKTITSTPTSTSVSVGSNQVNDTLDDNFSAANYYGSSALSAGTTRILMFVGGAAAILGLLLIISRMFGVRTRLQS